MRPLFAINLAAGLTFAFTFLCAIGGMYGYINTSRAIEKTKPTPVELESFKRDVADYYGSAVRNGSVAILQLPILIYARKLKRQGNIG